MKMKWFRRKLKKRNMYAVVAGQYIGTFIIFADDKPTNHTYPIITLPELVEQHLDEKIIQEGFDKNILDFVKRLHIKVYNEIIKQIEHKAKVALEETKRAENEYNNRREQLIASSILGKQK